MVFISCFQARRHNVLKTRHLLTLAPAQTVFSIRDHYKCTTI